MIKKIIVLLVILGFAFVLMLLTTGESHFEIRSQANFPVPQREVWQALVAVNSWPAWWPGMEESELVGTLRVGSEIQLRLKGMPARDSARLVSLRSEEEIAWEGAGIFGSRAGTRLLLAQDANGCRMTIENFVRGPQAFLARITGEEAFVKYQLKLLERLGLFLKGEPVSGLEKRIETAGPVD